jgi:hypothetical protein
MDFSDAMDYDPVMVNGKYDILFEVAKPKAGKGAADDTAAYAPKDGKLDERATRLCTKVMGKTFSFPTGAGKALAIPLPMLEE